MFSFCGDIVVLNETVVHVVYMHFLFLNQSWSAIKKIASIKGTSLIKTDVIGSKKKTPCLPSGWLTFLEMPD